MGFSAPYLKDGKYNRNQHSVALTDLDKHSYPSSDQEYHQEFLKTKQIWPSSRNWASSANDAWNPTMTPPQSTGSTPPLPQKPTHLFAFVNTRGSCFNMLKMNQFRPRQRKLRFPNSNCPHQWQHQRNDFHSRSGNAQGYMAAHPFQEQRHRCILRQSLWRKRTNTQQWQLLLMPEETIKMDTTNKPTVRPTTNITRANFS